MTELSTLGLEVKWCVVLVVFLVVSSFAHVRSELVALSAASVR